MRKWVKWMAIKPILFNTEMVRAILDGRKTCTRSSVSSRQFLGMLPDKCKKAVPDEFLKGKRMMFKPYCDMTDAELIMTAYKAPYELGDILYVRETWCLRYDGEKYFYKADKNTPREEKRLIDYNNTSWRPSIHMPKEAARIWLKVTDVRVERLQKITEDGAKAEGAIDNRGFIHSPENEYDSIHTAREHFTEIWNSTIKKSDLDQYGWVANPYVFVIEFERCEKPEGEAK